MTLGFLSYIIMAANDPMEQLEKARRREGPTSISPSPLQAPHGQIRP